MPISFPASLPWSFGWAPIVDAIEGTALEHVESHCDDGTELLLSQFKGKPRIEAVLCALLEGVQDLDDALWQLLTERWLLTAVGVQLDGLGAIVDLPRAGWPDETYRILLRAQVLVLRSKGRWQDLAAILEAIGVDLELAEFDEPSMAAIRVTIGEPFDGDIAADDAFRLIVRAKPAGVRLTFEYPTTEMTGVFTLGDSLSPSSSEDTGLGDAVAGGIGGELMGLLSTTEAP